jgi:hypothetical protein
MPPYESASSHQRSGGRTPPARATARSFNDAVRATAPFVQRRRAHNRWFVQQRRFAQPPVRATTPLALPPARSEIGKPVNELPAARTASLNERTAARTGGVLPPGNWCDDALSYGGILPPA